jgi:hypothetical protein
MLKLNYLLMIAIYQCLFIRIQTVTYTVADAYSGFVADVTYSGEARYDNAYKPAPAPVVPVAVAAPRPAYPAAVPVAAPYAPRPVVAAPAPYAPRVITSGPYRPAPY